MAVIYVGAVKNHQSPWKLLSRNGTFIQVGDDLPEFSTFDNSLIARSATFTTCDFLDILQNDPNEVSRYVFRLFLVPMLMYQGYSKIHYSFTGEESFLTNELLRGSTSRI
jgi:hypothetical protein